MSPTFTISSKPTKSHKFRDFRIFLLQRNLVMMSWNSFVQGIKIQKPLVTLYLSGIWNWGVKNSWAAFRLDDPCLYSALALASLNFSVLLISKGVLGDLCEHCWQV